MRRTTFLTALVFLGTIEQSPPSLAADSASGAASGSLRLASGHIAHYDYHFDRNALADCRRAGNSIIAITDSGALLGFDSTTLKPNREWFGPSPAVCLGQQANGELIVGIADGRICRLDPESFALTELAHLPSKPEFVTLRRVFPGEPSSAGLVAVIEGRRRVERDGESYEDAHSIVHDLARKKIHSLDEHATAFLLDSKNRLWLGTDRGEWGGSCSFIDLSTGVIHSLEGLPIYDFSKEKFWLGVFGFTELRDGQVWAFGGTTHMGHTEGYIWRVDRGKAEELYRLDNIPPKQKELIKRRAVAAKKAEEKRLAREKMALENLPALLKDKDDEPMLEDAERLPEPDPKTDPLPTDRPHLPISHIIEDKQTGAILVASFSDVYKTDAALRRWSKIHTLHIRYRSGRPDSVGAYPSVRSVLALEQPGKASGLLFGTRLDGLIRLSDGKQTHDPPSGQLGVDHVERIENTSEGTLVLDYRSEEDPWQLRDGKWRQVSFAPPFQPAPGDPIADLAPEFRQWSDNHLLVGPDGATFTLSSTGGSPGTRTTARWRDGKPEVLGREISHLYPSSTFVTPDGVLWSAWQRRALRFKNGRWAEVKPFEWPVADEDSLPFGTGLRVLRTGGPPWVLFDRDNEQLLKMSFIAQSQGARIELLSLLEETHRLKISDAIPWNKSSLLLATDRGLRIYWPDENKIHPGPIDPSPRPVTRLTRDGLGRLWLGGGGLAVVDPASNQVQSLNDLPMLGNAAISALSLDPAHTSGVILAIEGRGVLFLRFE